MTLWTGNGPRYSCKHSQTCLHERYQHQSQSNTSCYRRRQSMTRQETAKQPGG
jgi:hypothetical protein